MDDALIEMVVESVRVHMLSSRHVVILKETGRDRYLPIWIGPWEASAIAMAAALLGAAGAQAQQVMQERVARKPDRRWMNALRRAVEGVAGLTAVDGATLIKSFQRS